MIPPLSVNPKLFLLLALFAQHKTSELSQPLVPFFPGLHLASLLN